MAASRANHIEAPEEVELGELTFKLTLPDEDIQVAIDTHVKDNQPVTYNFTYRDFFERLQHPDPTMITKDGPGFMNGPCNGLRRKGNIHQYYFAVLDGDSSLDESGEITPGAPSPTSIHTALKELGLSHCIYTTFSHGTKGFRWRLLLPAKISSPGQLRGLITYVVELLRTHAELPVQLTQESVTWGNRWHFPRTAFKEAPFYSASYFGYEADPLYLARYYNQVDSRGQDVRTEIPTKKSDYSKHSIISQFCDLHPLPDMLVANGYTFHGQSVVVDENHNSTPVMRFRKPDSDSEPGVVVFWDEDRWRGFSHHKTDVMSTGKAFDSFDVLQYTTNQDDEDSDWLYLAAEQVRESMIGVMTRKHPVVLDGNKFRVGYLMDSAVGQGDEYRFLRWEDFNMKMANRPSIFVEHVAKDGSKGLRATDLASWWRTCKERQDYEGVVFQPAPIGSDYHRDIVRGDTKYFNLFNGWGITPAKGECELIEWHLLHGMCSGHEDEYEYLMDWLAHLFQFPDEKPNVAIVLRGPKGVGKTLVMSKLCASLGTLGTVIANSRQLTGDFNGHLRNKLLGVVEESFWAGKHTDEGPLKHIISDEHTTYERKGVDAESGRSFIRLVLITNNYWAAPASEDERRFFIPTVGTEAKERNTLEGNYFSRLATELDNGGINALIHKLTQRRISKNGVRYPPNTAGLVKQKLLSLGGLKAWVYDALRLGSFKDVKTGSYVVLNEFPKNSRATVEFLEESANSYLSRYESGRSTSTRIEMILEDIVGKIPIEVVGGKRTLILPSLQGMRQSFEAYLGSTIEWE